MSMEAVAVQLLDPVPAGKGLQEKEVIRNLYIYIDKQRIHKEYMGNEGLYGEASWTRGETGADEYIGNICGVYVYIYICIYICILEYIYIYI